MPETKVFVLMRKGWRFWIAKVPVDVRYLVSGLNSELDRRGILILPEKAWNR